MSNHGLEGQMSVWQARGEGGPPPGRGRVWAVGDQTCRQIVASNRFQGDETVEGEKESPPMAAFSAKVRPGQRARTRPEQARARAGAADLHTHPLDNPLPLIFHSFFPSLSSPHPHSTMVFAPLTRTAAARASHWSVKVPLISTPHFHPQSLVPCFADGFHC